jgi:hypothetical protein
MIVICTSFPAAAAALNLYVPVKSLAGATNALNASAKNRTTVIRRDVRTEIMGDSSTASPKGETEKMKLVTAFSRDRSPEGNCSTLILRVAILLGVT